MDFKVKDYVVYPLHGVGVIDKKVENKVNDKTTPFFKILMKDTGLCISIPVENASAMGLRKVISKSKIAGALKKLSTYPEKIEDNWKLRFQENIEKLKNGDIDNIVIVVKDLFIRNKIKNLSIMERKQYEQAYKMLVKEIAIAGDTDEDEVNNLISSKLDDLAAVHETKNFKNK